MMLLVAWEWVGSCCQHDIISVSRISSCQIAPSSLDSGLSSNSPLDSHQIRRPSSRAREVITLFRWAPGTRSALTGRRLAVLFPAGDAEHIQLLATPPLTYPPHLPHQPPRSHRRAERRCTHITAVHHHIADRFHLATPRPELQQRQTCALQFLQRRPASLYEPLSSLDQRHSICRSARLQSFHPMGPRHS